MDPAERLRDPLLVERFQEVVDHAELERLEGVRVVRGGEDEHRRAAGLDGFADEREPRALPVGARELDVGEDDVDREPGPRVDRLARLLERGHGADHFRKPGRLDELDEVVPRRPLVLDDERAQRARPRRLLRRRHDALASDCRCCGRSTIDRVPVDDDSRRRLA